MVRSQSTHCLEFIYISDQMKSVFPTFRNKMHISISQNQLFQLKMKELIVFEYTAVLQIQLLNLVYNFCLPEGNQWVCSS